MSPEFRQQIHIGYLKEARDLLQTQAEFLLAFIAGDEWSVRDEIEEVVASISDTLNLNRAIEIEISTFQATIQDNVIDEQSAEIIRQYDAMEKRQDRIDELCRENDDLFVTIGQKDRYIDELEARTDEFSYPVYTPSLEDENMAKVVQLLDETTSFEEWPAEAKIRKFEGVICRGIGGGPKYGMVVDAIYNTDSVLEDGVLYKITYMDAGQLRWRWSWASEVEAIGAVPLNQAAQDDIADIGWLIDHHLDRHSVAQVQLTV